MKTEIELIREEFDKMAQEDDKMLNLNKSLLTHVKKLAFEKGVELGESKGYQKAKEEIIKLIQNKLNDYWVYDECSISKDNMRIIFKNVLKELGLFDYYQEMKGGRTR
jgi:hypothetical protein